MSIISSWRPRRGRNVELLLLVFAIGIVLLAWTNVELATSGAVPSSLLTLGGGFLGLVLVVHLVLRFKASYADPILLPAVTLLNGLGLVMIHRLDIAHKRTIADGLAIRQLSWTAVSVVLALLVLLILRDHRILRKYTFTAGAAGVALLLLPMLPLIGSDKNGAGIWIQVGPFSFQPGEVSKILLAVFFAGYLVQTRDALSVAGSKVLGMTFPRGRDLGPILVAWAVSILILVWQRDLGQSLLFFGLFVAMLYVATERVSWVILGLVMFVGGAFLANALFAHVQTRVLLWLHTFSPEALKASDQLAKGLMGMGAGGMIGTGLGRGHPEITYFAETDFIVPSFGEELGMIGLFALLILYAVIVQRGFRTAIGTRDGFGKLLAVGLAFSVGLQVFVVVGGVTRVIPLTGLTAPFLSYGGSSLLANWVLVALLLRISDHARRPLPDPRTPAISTDDTQVVKPR